MSNKNEQGSMDVKQKNVLNAPLHKHSSSGSDSSDLPSTLHAGMCNTSNPIAAILTKSFIDSLGTSASLKPDQRYCLEASSWKKMADKGGDDVPKVKLESSHEAALKSVKLEVLKKYEAERDNAGMHGAARPKEGGEKWVRESKEIGGKEPRA